MTAWKPWMPRFAAFAVALLLGASVVYWCMRWPVQEGGAALPLPLASEELPPANAGLLAHLLGADASAQEAVAAPDAASRFRLTGVVALGAGKGVALLSIDGKPARPYRVGSTVEDGWVLQAVQPRSVALGADATGPQRLKLELPARQPG